MTEVSRRFKGELTAVDDNVADVGHRGDVGNLHEARARLGQRVAAHIQETVITAALVEEVETVRTADGSVAGQAEIADEVRHCGGRTIDDRTEATDTGTRHDELLIDGGVVTEDVEGRAVADGDVRTRTTEGGIIDHAQGARGIGDGTAEVTCRCIERHRARRGEVKETATHEGEREVNVVRAFDLEDALRIDDDRRRTDTRHAAHADGAGVDGDLAEGLGEARTRRGEEALRAEATGEEVQGAACRRTEGTDVGGIVTGLRDETDGRLRPTGILNERASVGRRRGQAAEGLNGTAEVEGRTVTAIGEGQDVGGIELLGTGRGGRTIGPHEEFHRVGAVTERHVTSNDWREADRITRHREIHAARVDIQVASQGGGRREGQGAGTRLGKVIRASDGRRVGQRDAASDIERRSRGEGQATGGGERERAGGRKRTTVEGHGVGREGGRR